MSGRLDLLVRGGLVYDGTGAPGSVGDVAVRDGRIVAVGAAPVAAAARVVEAAGLVVAPGFVDLHSHGDLVLAWPDEHRLDLLAGRLAQGITTEIVGNCGLGAAPAYGAGTELLPAINGWMSPAAASAPFRTLGAYFERLEGLGCPVNVGALVPHGPLRLGAMGLAPGEPDEAAMARMEDELDRALDEGAFGLSAGLIYPPGMFAATDELARLARRVERAGGVVACHIRGSSETLLPAVDELLALARDTGVAVHHSHVEAVGRAHWAKLEAVLERHERARERGARVGVDMFPYPVAATMMLAIYPPWALEGGVDRLLERLADETERRRIERDIETVVPGWPPWKPGGWPHNLVRAVGWDRIRIASVASEANRSLEGLSLAELGALRGRSPFDAVSDLLLEERGNVGQFVLDITGEDGLARLVGRPEIAFITDANDYGKGKPHPAAYGAFPRILAESVRRTGRLSWPEAIRRMTSLPASLFGIDDRGRLRPGAWADLVVFDPERVRDRADLDEPRRRAEGIVAVFVNGELVVENGAPTGALPGRILRRGEP